MPRIGVSPSFAALTQICSAACHRPAFVPYRLYLHAINSLLLCELHTLGQIKLSIAIVNDHLAPLAVYHDLLTCQTLASDVSREPLLENILTDETMQSLDCLDVLLIVAVCAHFVGSSSQALLRHRVFAHPLLALACQVGCQEISALLDIHVVNSMPV